MHEYIHQKEFFAYFHNFYLQLIKNMILEEKILIHLSISSKKIN